MSEQQFMQLAIDLARQGEGRTCPNPPVGAIVINDGLVVGEGFHPAAGQPHAEVYALREADDKACGATMYVTLEPCNHHGRTGPCTEAIIDAGITRVVVGTGDPNPEVAGRGINRLREEGIEVTVGVLERECRSLIAPFAKHVSTGLPYVTLKMAMTLDGRTATSTGDSKWISNEKSRLHVHHMRDRCDAIMVGVGTVLVDDPQLTTRLPDGGRDPVRIIVDSKLRIPASARVLAIDSTAPTIVATTSTAERDKISELESVGAEIIIVPDTEGSVDLPALMQALGKRDIQSILLEGGARLAAAALRVQMVDRVAVFIAPRLLAGSDGAGLFAGAGFLSMDESIRLQDVRSRQFDDDILVEGEIA